ncbi:MAG: MBL fold metallo-hydrolase [Chloroflexi bacterium]|nr:MBL fold metallo-hydrolase [Chloroflexota bacterium]
MDITWIGHAAIRMRARDAAVVMDPTDKSGGADMGRPPGEIITISHDHPHHNHVAGVKGEAMVIDGPGEYEVTGIHVEGMRSSLRPAEGAAAGPQRGTIFIFEAEELKLAHLGGLGVPLTAQQSEHLLNLDVLFIPIDCPEGLAAEQAARLTRALEPRIVIPIAYEPAAQGVAPALQAFVQTLGLSLEEPVSRLTLNRRAVSGDSTRIMLLESRG